MIQTLPVPPEELDILPQVVFNPYALHRSRQILREGDVAADFTHLEVAAPNVAVPAVLEACSHEGAVTSGGVVGGVGVGQLELE